MRFKIDRKKIEFEYEFLDGEVVKFGYKEPTTEMIDKSVELETQKEQLMHTKEVLRECLVGDETKIDKLIDEQMQEGNLYEFKREIDSEVGKLIKRG